MDVTKIVPLKEQKWELVWVVWLNLYDTTHYYNRSLIKSVPEGKSNMFLAGFVCSITLGMFHCFWKYFYSIRLTLKWVSCHSLLFPFLFCPTHVWLFWSSWRSIKEGCPFVTCPASWWSRLCWGRDPVGIYNYWALWLLLMLKEEKLMNNGPVVFPGSPLGFLSCICCAWKCLQRW